MSKPYTHVLEQYPEAVDQRGQRRPAQSILFRAADGMAIGARQGTIVQLGEDMAKSMARTYRDEKYAEAALKRFADDDQRALVGGDQTAGATIEIVDCSHTVIQPSLGDITSVKNGRRQ